MMHSYYSL